MNEWRDFDASKIIGLARSWEPKPAEGRWPKPRTIGRIVLFAMIAVILGGWLLTFVTSFR